MGFSTLPTRALALAGMLAFSSTVTAIGTYEFLGCYTSAGSLIDNGTYIYQSDGYCQTQCAGMNMPVMGLINANDCWCGTSLPPSSDQTSNSTCNLPCAGYGSNTCGGKNAWSIFSTGVSVVETGAQASESSSTSTTQSVLTVSGATITATVSPESHKNTTSKSGTSPVGIAVGVVIGLLVLGALIFGVWFFLRRKRLRDAEQAYQQHAAVSNFLKEGRPGTSGADSRLDPSTNARRLSDGSIADNEDFSRRILKVTNY